jgi:hypothetical protein
VVVKFGAVDSNSKFSAPGNNPLKWYIYLNSDKKTSIYFNFYAERVDDYQGERIPYMSII